MTAMLAGLSAGALHALSGPDHLAALGPIAARVPSAGMRAGALWGLGHGAGVVAAGLVVRALAGAIELETVSAIAERAVGVTLVVVGARAMWIARRASTGHHAAPHARAGALGFGVLHGAAGAGHLFALLPALVLGELETFVYLGGYVVAATIAMSLAGALVGLMLIERAERVRRRAVAVSGLIAITVGVAWIALASSSAIVPAEAEAELAAPRSRSFAPTSACCAERRPSTVRCDAHRRRQPSRSPLRVPPRPARQ